MSILIQSREPVAPPLPDRDVWAWDIPGQKNAVVVEQRPSGYAVSGPLLFPSDPFATEPLNASTDAGAIAEARAHVVAVLTRRAEENMALANAFAADGEPAVSKLCRRCTGKYRGPNARLCPACVEEITGGADDAEPDDDSTLELDQAEVAAALAVALGELRTAYPAGGMD